MPHVTVDVATSTFRNLFRDLEQLRRNGEQIPTKVELLIFGAANQLGCNAADLFDDQPANSQDG